MSRWSEEKAIEEWLGAQWREILGGLITSSAFKKGGLCRYLIVKDRQLHQRCSLDQSKTRIPDPRLSDAKRQDQNDQEAARFISRHRKLETFSNLEPPAAAREFVGKVVENDDSLAAWYYRQ